MPRRWQRRSKRIRNSSRSAACSTSQTRRNRALTRGARFRERRGCSAPISQKLVGLLTLPIDQRSWTQAALGSPTRNAACRVVGGPLGMRVHPDAGNESASHALYALAT
eukprot:901555-Pelagomonas_calceolata.AAC.2